jgi:hypothetical protein
VGRGVVDSVIQKKKNVIKEKKKKKKKKLHTIPERDLPPLLLACLPLRGLRAALSAVEPARCLDVPRDQLLDGKGQPLRPPPLEPQGLGQGRRGLLRLGTISSRDRPGVVGSGGNVVGFQLIGGWWKHVVVGCGLL